MAAGTLQRLKALAWRLAFARWPARPEAEAGYSLLLPVPADLPVFLHLALANAAFQAPEGRRETLVLPDRPAPAFREAFAAAAGRYEVGPLRLVEPDRRARTMGRVAGSPGANHFMQVHAGVCAARSRHVLLHDADLFIEDRAFMRRHHELAAQSGVGCLGVSPAWDDWLRDHGFDHVVATWELMADLRWMRSFAPWRHHPHEEVLAGERHLFDLTLYPQAISPPAVCRLHDAAESFVHFNYVISVYRHFRREDPPFEDYRFLLLLIRLLSDAHGTPAPGIPPVAELAAGVTDRARRVTYTDPETAGRYPEFREKLGRILDGPLLDALAAESIAGGLETFERAIAPAVRAASS